jgi:hypothetical protein
MAALLAQTHEWFWDPAGGYNAELGPVSILSSAAICDDAFCATGEQDQCPSSTACKPSGGTCGAPPANRAPGEVCGGATVGRCPAARTGVADNACECSEGFAGADCGECAPGYEELAAPATWGWGPNGTTCGRLPAATTLDPTMAAPISASSPAAPTARSSSSRKRALSGGAIAGIVLGAVGAVALVAVIVVVVWAMHRSRSSGCRDESGQPVYVVNSPLFGTNLMGSLRRTIGGKRQQEDQQQENPALNDPELSLTMPPPIQTSASLQP